MCLTAQNLSVYGVTLGDSKYKVQNVLENKGKSIKKNRTKEGIQYFKVTNVNIGGADFASASFNFDNNGTLYKVGIYSQSSGGLGSPGMPWENEFRRLAKSNEYLFMTMSQNLKMKYGEPTVESDNRIVWKIGISA